MHYYIVSNRATDINGFACKCTGKTLLNNGIRYCDTVATDLVSKKPKFITELDRAFVTTTHLIPKGLVSPAKTGWKM